MSTTVDRAGMAVPLLLLATRFARTAPAVSPIMATPVVTTGPVVRATAKIASAVRQAGSSAALEGASTHQSTSAVVYTPAPSETCAVLMDRARQVAKTVGMKDVNTETPAVASLSPGLSREMHLPLSREGERRARAHGSGPRAASMQETTPRRVRLA